MSLLWTLTSSGGSWSAQQRGWVARQRRRRTPERNDRRAGGQRSSGGHAGGGAPLRLLDCHLHRRRVGLDLHRGDVALDDQRDHHGPLHLHDGQPYRSQGREEQVEFAQKR